MDIQIVGTEQGTFAVKGGKVYILSQDGFTFDEVDFTELQPSPNLGGNDDPK